MPFRGDADTKYLELTTNIGLSTDFGYSVTVWFRPTSAPTSNWHCIFAPDNGSSWGPLIHRYDSDFGGRLTFASGAGDIDFGVAANTTTEWYFVGASFLPTGSSDYYPNGVLIQPSKGIVAVFTVATSSYITSSYTPNKLRIGGDNWGESGLADICDVRYWPGVKLTAQELIAEAYSRTPVRQSGLGAWWPIDHPGNMGRDLSGNSRHMTVNGSPVFAPDTRPPMWRHQTRQFFIPAAAGGGTSVSNDFVASHEAIQILQPTYSGGHECIVTLSPVSYAGVHEAGQGVALSAVGAHEAIQLLAASLSGAHESIQFLQPEYSGTHESIQSLLQTMDGAHEATQALTQDATGAHEATSTAIVVSKDHEGTHEAIQALQPTYAGAHEAGMFIPAAYSGAHEAGLGVAASSSGAHEAIGSVTGDSSGVHEAIRALQAGIDGAHEAIQALSGSTVGAHEAGGGVAAGFDGAHEATSNTTPVSQDFTGAHEALEEDEMADLDAEQILTEVYDPDNTALRVTAVGTASGEFGTALEWQQIIEKVYDDALNTLRVVEVS